MYNWFELEIGKMLNKNYIAAETCIYVNKLGDLACEKHEFQKFRRHFVLMKRQIPFFINNQDYYFSHFRVFCCVRVAC